MEWIGLPTGLAFASIVCDFGAFFLMPPMLLHAFFYLSVISPRATIRSQAAMSFKPCPAGKATTAGGLDPCHARFFLMECDWACRAGLSFAVQSQLQLIYLLAPVNEHMLQASWNAFVSRLTSQHAMLHELLEVEQGRSDLIITRFLFPTAPLAQLVLEQSKADSIGGVFRRIGVQGEHLRRVVIRAFKGELPRPMSFILPMNGAMETGPSAQLPQPLQVQLECMRVARFWLALAICDRFAHGVSLRDVARKYRLPEQVMTTFDEEVTRYVRPIDLSSSHRSAAPLSILAWPENEQRVPAQPV